MVGLLLKRMRLLFFISVGLVVDFCGSYESNFLFVFCSLLNIMIHNSPAC